MNLETYISKAKAEFENRFNPFLEKVNADHEGEEGWKDLLPIASFTGSEYLLKTEERSIAIYLCSPSGTTYSETENGIETGMTVSFYLNEDASAESEEEALRYYAALILFIESRHFSEHDLIDDSILLLSSLGYGYNGAALYIKSRLASSMDDEYLKELFYGN